MAAQVPSSPSMQINVDNQALRDSLRSDLSASLRALSQPNPVSSSQVYTKIAEAAVQVYTTLSVLVASLLCVCFARMLLIRTLKATFLAGLQAGLISRNEGLLAQSNLISHNKRILFSIGSCVGTAGLLLELTVVTLSTLIVLSLTLDKLSAVASQSIRQDNMSDKQAHTLLFFQAQIAELKAFKPRKVTNSRNTGGKGHQSSGHILDNISGSLITQILAKLKGSFWVLGSILLLGTVLTIVHVILISWDNRAAGITATSLCMPMIVLALKVAHALSKRSVTQLDSDLEKAEHVKTAYRKLHKQAK